MATDKKSSVLVNSTLPEFLDTEGPKFQAFVRAYYEWLETTNQVTDRSKNLLEYADIDRTEDEFVDWFRKEILVDFPKDILADKRSLYQRITELYRAKGSENAYKLLFRLLFNEEIEFYYPGQDILRVSDGRWVKEQSIRLSAPFIGDLNSFGGENIVGTESGATAKVLRVVSTLETGVDVYELFLSGVIGSFKDNEIVRNTNNTIRGSVISATGPLQGVVVQFGGARHTNGDTVSLTSASGSGATGVIVGTTGESITPAIVSGGSGYRTSSTITLSGGNGSGAEFEITAISNTETVQTYDDVILDLRDTRIDANTYISSNTDVISANLAVANSSTPLSAALGTSNTIVGTISGVRAVKRGSNYTVAPSVTAIDREISLLRLPDGLGGFKGENANLRADLVAGALTRVLVTSFGSNYNRSDLVTISNNSNPSAEPAIGAPQVSGVISYPGKYVDTKGFISWNNKIQDNNYFQEFSYALRSSKSIDSYREVVKNVTHAAGTKLFGDHVISSNISMEILADSYSYLLLDVTLGQLTTTFGNTSIVSVINATTINSVSTLSNDATINYAITPVSIDSTVSFGSIESIDMLVGGLTLIAINPTTTFGDILLSNLIELTSITFNPVAFLRDASVQQYASNTVSQLQTSTFNTSYSKPQVGQPVVEYSP